MGRFKRTIDIPLCACGCGKSVKPNWRGKGGWNRFINHHAINEEYKKDKESISPLCACGCNCQVGWNSPLKQWNKYIKGHHVRGSGNPMYGSCRKGELNPFYGRGHAVEMKKKLSIASSGNTNASGKWPDARRKKYVGKGNPFYGRKHTQKTLLRISLVTSGENNPRWKGGISCEPYCKIWLDEEYKQSIKDRDNNECQNSDCWGNSKKLTLHHIDYVKKNCGSENLITLCNSCNIRANGNREEWINFYQEIMSMKYGYNYGIVQQVS